MVFHAVQDAGRALVVPDAAVKNDFLNVLGAEVAVRVHVALTVISTSVHEVLVYGLGHDIR